MTARSRIRSRAREEWLAYLAGAPVTVAATALGTLRHAVGGGTPDTRDRRCEHASVRRRRARLRATMACDGVITLVAPAATGSSELTRPNYGGTVWLTPSHV